MNRKEKQARIDAAVSKSEKRRLEVQIVTDEDRCPLCKDGIVHTHKEVTGFVPNYWGGFA